MNLTIRFWGVRGSIATPGPRTVRTGGNTPCVEISCEDTLLILDAGTGIRDLGERLMREDRRDATLLLSHLHWDHIQGLPFFVPAYVPGRSLTIRGARGLQDALSAQMTAPSFPVTLDAFGADVAFRAVVSGERFDVGPFSIQAAGLNHPGGVLGYRVTLGDRSIVYATDTEHYACPDPRLIDLARDADVLIYDAMYTDAEYPTKVGWGHSTWTAGVDVADAAGVDRLVLFHHDPTRDDDAVDAIERAAAATRGGTVAAREGESLVLAATPGARRAA
ncbi:MAG: MBL fold metallo-hydrolase [Sandaracinaceae bacterium]